MQVALSVNSIIMKHPDLQRTRTGRNSLTWELVITDDKTVRRNGRHRNDHFVFDS